MWVPLVENNEHESAGADYFIQKNLNHLLNRSVDIDTVILACTHYPLLLKKIKQFLPARIEVISQGKIVAESLKDYLFRHPEVEMLCSQGESREFLTTESPEEFSKKAKLFLGEEVTANRLTL
jgi:glutamate racemase